LLFDEPLNIDEVFAKEHGDFEMLTKTEVRVYKKTAKSGRENRYIYKEGKLQKAIIDGGAISFSIQLKE
jgi:hypothetical protein